MCLNSNFALPTKRLFPENSEDVCCFVVLIRVLTWTLKRAHRSGPMPKTPFSLEPEELALPGCSVAA